MANTISPNMNLIIPGVGTEAGPTYAQDVNSSLTLVDQHDHSLGSGVQITPAGLNINAALTLNNNSLINVQNVQFTAQAGNSSLQNLYVAPGTETPLTQDLWFNDSNGGMIQITSGGTVNASIASLPGESYAAGTFYWKQGTGSTVPANFDIGSIVLRPNTAGTSFGVQLTPASGISSQYSLALPLLPGVQSFLTLDNAGNIVASTAFSGGITSSNISPTANILGSQLSATAGIIGTQLANNTITATQIANATITSTQIAADTVTPGNLTTLNSLATSSGISGSLTNTNVSNSISSGFTPTPGRPVYYNFTGYLSIAGSSQSTTVTVTIISGLSTVVTNQVVMSTGASSADQMIPMSAFHCVVSANNVGSTHSTTVNIAASGSTLTYTNVAMNVIY